jgi:hypothetical protein
VQHHTDVLLPLSADLAHSGSLPSSTLPQLNPTAMSRRT